MFLEFQQEKRATYRADQPLTDFGQFRCKKLYSLIDEAYNLYNNQFIKHIKTFYQQFQKWFKYGFKIISIHHFFIILLIFSSSDFVKFNNNIVYIENKLLACQKSLESCKTNIDKDIDAKLNCIIEFINGRLHGTNETPPQPAAAAAPAPHHQPQHQGHQNNNTRDINNNQNNSLIGFERLLNNINSTDMNESVVNDYNSINSLVER